LRKTLFLKQDYFVNPSTSIKNFIIGASHICGAPICFNHGEATMPKVFISVATYLF